MEKDKKWYIYVKLYLYSRDGGWHSTRAGIEIVYSFLDTCFSFLLTLQNIWYDKWYFNRSFRKWNILHYLKSTLISPGAVSYSSIIIVISQMEIDVSFCFSYFVLYQYAQWQPGGVWLLRDALINNWWCIKILYCSIFKVCSSTNLDFFELQKEYYLLETEKKRLQITYPCLLNETTSLKII